MNTQTYTPQAWISIREAIENAIKMARATGKQIIIQMSGVRFCVNRDTDVQEAINTYLEVLDKVKKTEQQLKQKVRE